MYTIYFSLTHSSSFLEKLQIPGVTAKLFVGPDESDVIKVDYDFSTVELNNILDLFFESHDAFDEEGISKIYYTDEEEESTAVLAREGLDFPDDFSDPVTVIVPADFNEC